MKWLRSGCEVVAKELKEDMIWMGVEGSTGCEFGRDFGFKAADLRPATEMCVGSNPTARILFFKCFKHVKSNMQIF